MSIIKLLSKKLDRIIFTTPSHNQKPLFSKKYKSFYKEDFSEIEGFDNLLNPKGAILLSQAKVSDIFNTKQTFFITQGATSAILVAMKSVIKQGEKVLVARNCHKSVYNGLILTNANVDWFLPEENTDWGIYEKIDEKKLENTLKFAQYKTFIMTSPTYEGINSNIEEISKICKAYGVVLIVDEAHGSLYNFSDKLPKTAIEQGADISINSLHKTAGALNQCAILNISNKCPIEIETIRKTLNIFHTTSPSYPLIANIEACINYLNSKKGRKEIDKLLLNIDKLKNKLSKYDVEFYENPNHDKTKILIRKKGVSGFDLSEILFEKYNIEDEMCNANSCLFLTGIGTTSKKITQLKSALKKIKANSNHKFEKLNFQPMPLVKFQPYQALDQDYKFTKKNEALYEISNEIILPYPPGIGLLYPGEMIQEWHLKYLKEDTKTIINRG